MASPEQLALLQAGVEGWNEWRGKELDKDIDLTGSHETLSRISFHSELNPKRAAHGSM
jgi:hypothetical protein